MQRGDQFCFVSFPHFDPFLFALFYHKKWLNFWGQGHYKIYHYSVQRLLLVIMEMDQVRKSMSPEEHKISAVKRQKKYLESNREKVNERRRKHYEKNKKKINDKRKFDYANKKEKKF